MTLPTSAMVLAAGLGLRMRPLTETTPKPLVEVAGKKLIDYSLDMLAEAGVKNAVVNVSYKGDLIEAHVKQRNKPAIHISREEAPLETGGGIAKALPLLGASPFFSMNSDAITVQGPQALQHLANNWEENILALLLIVPRAQAHGYEGVGDFFMGEGGKIRRRKEHETAPYIFTGMQMLHPKLFENSPAGAFSLNVLYDRHIGADGWFHNICVLVYESDWLHVGDMKGLKAAEEFFTHPRR